MIASSSPFPSSIVDHIRITFGHSLVVIIYGNRYANMRVLDSNLYHLDKDNVVVYKQDLRNLDRQRRLLVANAYD